ncbi:MAG: acyltransferase family protein [Clostridiales bacterium]|nr:acyltransferase family protein [Clostridiales bacterium]
MRKYYLDNLRWVTVLTVAVYHVFFLFNEISQLAYRTFSDVQYQDSVLYLIYPWIMVLLFLIAGMSSRYYLEKHTVKEFIRSRTTKLLVPSTIGVLLFGWMQGYISMKGSGAFEDGGLDNVPLPIKILIMDLSGTSILWFSQLLWLISMLLALVVRFEKGKLYSLTSKTTAYVAAALVIPVWLSGQILNLPIISVYRFGIYPFLFFLGYFVFAHDEVIERLARIRIPLVIVAAALGVTYLVLHFGDDAMAMPVMGSIPAVAYCWAMCLALLGSFKAWFDFKTSFTEYMTKRSFAIYTFHYFTMSAVAILLVAFTDAPAFAHYLAVLVIGLAGAFALAEIIPLIPFVRWCLLGIRKPKTIKEA